MYIYIYKCHMQFQIIKTNNLLSNTRYKIIPLYRRRIESETTQKV